MGRISNSAQFLREERARKIDLIEICAVGSCGMRELSGGISVDTTDVWIASLKRQVAEMEVILTMAGEPFDA